MYFFFFIWENSPCLFCLSRVFDCGLTDLDEPTRPHWENCNPAKDTKIMYNCTLSRDSKPWCAVHKYQNDTEVQLHYGYCSQGCHGEIPTSSRPEHLANPLFKTLWTTNIYDLDPWKAGVCHTYTPNETFHSGTKGQLYAFLGDGLKKARLLLHKYDIYLHDKKVQYVQS